jgi:hypothetical protein
VQTKGSCVRNNKCLSCCCFVFGCVGNSSVEVEKKVNRHQQYFDEEEPYPSAHPLDNAAHGGASSPQFEPLDEKENISFDGGVNSSSMRKDPNSTVDKLNATSATQAKKVNDPDEHWQ